MKIAAIVPAAGEGKRMGSKIKKPFLLLKGKPILAHTLDLLERQGNIDKIWVAGPQEELTELGMMAEKYHYQKVAGVVVGGKTRQESVWNALKEVGLGWDMVLVHDAVRPLCPSDRIQEVISMAQKTHAAILAVPEKETIKSLGPSALIEKTLDRDRLWVAQTPQVFDYTLLLRAYKEAREQGFIGTDESSLVERLPHPVTVVEGSYQNIKITTPDDLVMAELILFQRPAPPEAA